VKDSYEFVLTTRT